MLRKLLILAALAAVIAAYFGFGLGQYLTFDGMKAAVAAWEAFYAENPVLVLALFFLAYVVVTAASLPGAAIMTLAAGALFGLVMGTVLVSFASTMGAGLAFLSARYVLRDGLEIGASVGLNGVCMTVTRIENDRVHFDAMQETLSLTTLGQLAVGDLVNVERSAKQGAEIGGHLISGHVDGRAVVTAVERSENNLTLFFQLPKTLVKYVFRKGFIGLHGCSLTVASMDSSRGVFSVCLIPETLRSTNLGALSVGAEVNIEVDRQTQVIVDTVERVLAEREAAQ